MSNKTDLEINPNKEVYALLENICEDIDECETGKHDCLTPDIETCYNTVGNYVCEPIDPEENEGRITLMTSWWFKWTKM